jgi:peptidyl-tRNA hydrolase
VLDVARGVRVLVELVFNIMHVRTFVEKYIKEKWCGDCRKKILLSVPTLSVADLLEYYENARRMCVRRGRIMVYRMSPPFLAFSASCK